MGKLIKLIGNGIKKIVQEVSLEGQSRREVKRNNLIREMFESEDRLTIAELQHRMIKSPHFQKLYVIALLQDIFGSRFPLLLPGAGHPQKQTEESIELLGRLGEILEENISHVRQMVISGQIDENTALDLIQDARARVERIFQQAMGGDEG